jgi:hypothetical protein
MKKVVTLKKIIRVVESIEAEHQVIQKKLVDFRKALKLLDSKATIEVQAGKVVPYAVNRPNPDC